MLEMRAVTKKYYAFPAVDRVGFIMRRCLFTAVTSEKRCRKKLNFFQTSKPLLTNWLEEKGSPTKTQKTNY
jgi:hypothetical protein